jgi:hypothetical protein
MKALSIILTLALLAVMSWLVLDSRSQAKGAQNQLELLRRQQPAKAAASGNDAQLAAMETQLLAEQMKKSVPAPASSGTSAAAPLPALSPAPVPRPAPGVARSPAVAAAIEAANAAPLPATPRQRQITAAPKLAEVKQFAKDYGFVEITAGSGSRIEVGMGFAIRRGNAIIGRIKVTDVENNSAVADVDSRSLPPGVIIETGDEVIQDLPPES